MADKGKCPMIVARTIQSIAIALSALPVNAALAQDADDRGDRAVQITPYVWAAGYGGTLRASPAGPTLRVSRGFGELVQDLDAAFFVTGLARKDRFVIVADVSHVATSRDGFVPTGNPAVPLVPAEGRLKQTSLTLLGGYRVVDDRDVSIDLLGGFRAWWVRPSVAVPLLGGTAAADLNFADPIVAARGNIRIAPRWSGVIYGDIGGFGAGSDVTAQAVGTINYRIGRAVWLSGGYRYLLVDYKSGGRRIDSSLGGPLLGVTLTF